MQIVVAGAKVRRVSGATLILSLSLCLMISRVCVAAEWSVPPFDLAKFGSTERVRLEAFRGQIVVLDFFGYWCLQCRDVSMGVQRDIARYYAGRGGNAHAVPVTVIGVNIERDYQEKTRQFIRKAGFTLVANDPSGDLLAKLGGVALPYLVVLDGTGADWRVARREEGYEGPGPLRQAIDRIEAPEGGATAYPAGVGGIAASSDVPPSSAIARRGQWLASWQCTLESDAELMATEDLTLWDVSGSARAARGPWNLSISMSEGWIEGVYTKEPYNLGPLYSDLGASRQAYQAEMRYRLPDRLTWLGGAGFYDGFSDYRSLWLAESYRRRWSSIKSVYTQPDPHGYHASGGVRWEFVPASAFLQTEVVVQNDIVAPGYDKAPFQPLVRRRDNLDTVSGRAQLENVLNPWLRTLHEFQVTDTTERQLRLGYRGNVNVALGERWVLGPALDLAREGRVFHSWSAGLGVQRDWDNRYFAGISGRYYQDSGEPNQSLPQSEASPPLAAWQAAADFRWVGERASLRLSVGPYFSRYDVGASHPTSFPALYANRDWWDVRLALSLRL